MNFYTVKHAFRRVEVEFHIKLCTCSIDICHARIHHQTQKIYDRIRTKKSIGFIFSFITHAHYIYSLITLVYSLSCPLFFMLYICTSVEFQVLNNVDLFHNYEMKRLISSLVWDSHALVLREHNNHEKRFMLY